MLHAGLDVQTDHVPHQPAGPRAGDSQADQSPIVLGHPGALGARALRERARDQLQVGHSATLGLDTRPGVSGNLGSASATPEGRKRDRIEWAKRANKHLR